MTAPSPSPSSTDTSEVSRSGEASLIDQALARYQAGAAPEDLIEDFLAITSQAPHQSAGWTCLAWLQLLLDHQYDETAIVVTQIRSVDYFLHGGESRE